ncbi:MAG: hypothetical protein P8X86_08185 [Desulfofustis sp.]
MMSTLLHITQKEFSTFFSSPIAFIFLGVFLATTLFVVFWVETFFARNIADVRPLFEWMPILLISGFEIEPEVDNWFDKNAVKRTRDKIAKLRIGALQLEKSGKDWVLDGEEPTELATEAVNDLVDYLANLSVQSVLDPDQVKKLFAEGPELQLSLTEDEGGDINYEFVKADDHFVLKTSDSDVYYKINSWQVEKLKEFTRAKITHSETEENQPDDGSA